MTRLVRSKVETTLLLKREKEEVVPVLVMMFCTTGCDDVARQHKIDAVGDG
jgi:hypothetical protein